MPTDNGHLHYFNHNQKLFEIGQDSTIGLVTWGLGGLATVSYRTLIARLNDEFEESPPKSVLEVAQRWSSLVWGEYNKAFPRIMAAARELELKEARSPREEQDFDYLRFNYHAGFCLAGYMLPGRTPEAYSVEIAPTQRTPGQPVAIHRPEFWGAPNFIRRLMFGYDPGLRKNILESGFWHGTPKQLDELLSKWALDVPTMPIRDAIDYAYSSIHSTIKALKFSSLPQICGGPIEIAVITTDRRFRWVRHKSWDAAIEEGEL